MLRRQRLRNIYTDTTHANLRNIYTDTTHANNTQQATPAQPKAQNNIKDVRYLRVPSVFLTCTSRVPAQPKAQNNIKDTFWRRFLLASLFSKVIFFFMYTGDGGGVFLAWERGVEPGLYVCIYANVLLICC